MAEFSTSERTSYGGRFGQSIGKAGGGLLLFLIAFPLLFWNEGRAVNDARRLEEGSKAVVSASAEKVDPANEGKEICITGEAATADRLGDPAAHLSLNALALSRHVEMYQWKETSKEEKKTGGSSVTTYSYDKVWSSSKINSGSFHTHVTPDRERMSNPTDWPVDQKSWWAKNVTIGAYKLSDDLIHQIQPSEALPPKENDSTTAPATEPTTAETAAPDEEYKVLDGTYYSGFDPLHPEIGDMKITFKVAKPQPVSVVAQQKGNTFVPYPTKAGGEIEMLRTGTHSAGEMFDMAKADAAMMTWVLRVVGFVMMAIGISLALKPLTMLVAFLPFLEGIADMATGAVAFLGALVCSLLTIGLAWLFYRPVAGIALLAVAGACAYLLHKSRRKRAMATA